MKPFAFVAGAATFAYMMLFSDAAAERRAAEVMRAGQTPSCESPQVEQAAMRELRQVSTAADAQLSSFRDESAQHNQRTCVASFRSRSSGVSAADVEFTVELYPPPGGLIVIFD